MKRYKITIDVIYDDAHPIPEDLELQLHDNVTRCVTSAELLNDSNLEAVVEFYDHTVECVG